MANTVKVGFFVEFIGDGSSATLVVNTATSPISLLAAGGGGADLPSGFSISTTVPLDTANLSCSGGLSVSASISSGVITFTFGGGPPVDGGLYEISGDLTF